MGRRVAGAAVVLIVAGALAGSLFLARCFLPETRPTASRFVLRPLNSVGALPGWNSDDPGKALAVFRRSCRKLTRLDPDEPVGRDGLEGYGRDWRGVCRAARQVAATPSEARAFFERSFIPFAVLDQDGSEGLFTGYYEPELRGSRTRSVRYHVPLLGRPDDLIQVDLGAFAPDLEGRRIAGRLNGKRLESYPDRAAIEAGSLGRKAKPILWLEDPIQAFFLHIQGSGRVVLDDGEVIRVGYAGQNGRPYVAIGRVLVRRGELEREQVSLQSIRDWLATHPSDARSVMNANPSYVFFRVLDNVNPDLGPPGSQQVPLTPGRSLAIDRSFHGLGIPIWLDTTLPDPKPASPDRALRRLMIAQDTGGAIKGPIRGDVFWGFGPDAEAIAGRMKSRGRMFVLLPRSAAGRLDDRIAAAIPNDPDLHPEGEAGR